MNKATKINFILPFKPRRPAGGFRIMYEYANRLAEKGYAVHLTFPLTTQFMDYRIPYPLRFLKSKLEGFRTDRWFSFHPSITMSYVPAVTDKYIEDADVVIATWWATVLGMSELSDSKGRKINLIQGFENWEGRVDLLYKSYDLPEVTNIVVANYLYDIINKHTKKKTEIVHNAISTQSFCVKNPIRERNPYKILMTYSIQEIKGSNYGLEAVKIVKAKYPEIEVDLFGICQTPKKLPTWIKYYRNPDNLPDIYNKASIFLSNSLTEGFSLVSAESMFCGCALICTDIGGHREYAVDERNSLIVEPKNSVQMADKICELLADNEKRIRLAEQGNKDIQRFEWNNSIEKMETIITDLIKSE